MQPEPPFLLRPAEKSAPVPDGAAVKVAAPGGSDSATHAVQTLFLKSNTGCLSIFLQRILVIGIALLKNSTSYCIESRREKESVLTRIVLVVDFVVT